MFVTAAITGELAKDYLTLHAKALKGLLLCKRVHLVNKIFFRSRSISGYAAHTVQMVERLTSL